MSGMLNQRKYMPVKSDLRNFELGPNLRMGDSDPNSAFLLTKSRVDSIESRILSQRSRIEIKEKKPLFNFGR